MELEDIPVDIRDFIYWMNSKYSNSDFDDNAEVCEAIDWMAQWDKTLDGALFWEKIHAELYDDEETHWDAIRECKEYALCFPPEEPGVPLEAHHIDSVRKFIDGNT